MTAQVSKARKILKRTLVGTSLVGAVTLLLWWNSTSADGAPLFWTAAVVLVATIYEVSRMGALARMELLPPLLGALAVGIAIAHAEFDPELDDSAKVRLVSTGTWIGLFVMWVALSGSALLNAVKRWRAPDVVARAATYALAAGAVIFGTRNAPVDIPYQSERITLGVLTAICFLGAISVRRWVVTQRIVIAGALAIWIIPPLLLVWTIWDMWGTRGLVALMVLSKFGDTCGYYVGSTLGKTHPFPKISPGKTTAGCVGSFVGVTAMSGILWWAGVVPDGHLGLWGALVAGATLNIAAQAGDLLKSWTKRRAGVKDSSTIFGPAGGLLDQVDSLLLTVPMACLTWPYLFG